MTVHTDSIVTKLKTELRAQSHKICQLSQYLSLSLRMSSKEEAPELPLPSDQMPACWKQDERMNSLFAEFRNRSVNPQDWNSKYKFWHDLILDWLQYHMRCSFSTLDLNVVFKRNGCTARCLSTVVQELYRNRELMLESDFLQEPSNSWTGWAIDILVKRPVSWSFMKIKDYVKEPVVNVNTTYIHMQTVRDLAEVVLSVTENKKENILLTLSEITKCCREKTKNQRITESNVRLALIWLRRTKRAAFRNDDTNNKNELLVKVSRHGVTEVTEVEEGIYKLMEQESMLIKNIEQLELERNEVMGKAKASVASDLRQVAKTFLRKKHEIDKCIEKRSGALQNVQQLLSKIHDAHSDTETLAAYKAGCNVLKKFEDTGLTEDKVRDTMDDMSEAMQELKEVQSAMTQPIVNVESDSELEKELEEILGDTSYDSTTKDKTFDSDILPDLLSLNLQDLPPAPVKYKFPSSTPTKL